MIYYLFNIIVFLKCPKNVVPIRNYLASAIQIRIRKSGLRIRGSASERNIYSTVRWGSAHAPPCLDNVLDGQVVHHIHIQQLPRSILEYEPQTGHYINLVFVGEQSCERIKHIFNRFCTKM